MSRARAKSKEKSNNGVVKHMICLPKLTSDWLEEKAREEAKRHNVRINFSATVNRIVLREKLRERSGVT